MLCPTPPPEPGQPRSTRPRRSSSETCSTAPTCSAWPSRATSTPASTTPRTDVLEARVAALEGGVAAVATASGQSAETLALLDPCHGRRPRRQQRQLVRRHVQPVPLHASPSSASRCRSSRTLTTWRSGAAHIRPNTRAFFAETLGNPRSNVLDVRGVADVAHSEGIPLVVDNTVPTPYLLRPIEHGADIVVHSATKYLGGHGTVIGGIVVDGGTFDFGAPRRAPPVVSSSRTRVTTACSTGRCSGPGAYAAKLRVQFLRDIGPAISPHSAFLLHAGHRDALAADRAARAEHPGAR